MLAVILQSLVIAIGNALDIFTDVFAITKGQITPIQLGLLGTVAYLVYIFGLYLGGRLGDRGILRLQLFIVVAALILYAMAMEFYLETKIFMFIAILYLLYPLVQSFSLTTVTAYIHEFYPGFQWSIMLMRRSIITRVFEVFMLLLIARNINFILSNVYLFFTLIISLSVFTLIIVKNPQVRIERILYRIESGVSRVTESIVTSLFVYELLQGDHRILVGGFRRLESIRPRYKNPRRILLSLSLLRLSSSLFFTQLPVYLNSIGASSSSMLDIYMLARVVLITTYVLTAGYTGMPRLLLAIRSAVLLLLLYSSLNNIVVAIVVGLILYINGQLEIALYSMYTSALGRADANVYIMIGETTGMIATSISGPLYSLVSYKNLVLLSSILSILSLVCLS